MSQHLFKLAPKANPLNRFARLTARYNRSFKWVRSLPTAERILRWKLAKEIGKEQNETVGTERDRTKRAADVFEPEFRDKCAKRAKKSDDARAQTERITALVRVTRVVEILEMPKSDIVDQVLAFKIVDDPARKLAISHACKNREAAMLFLGMELRKKYGDDAMEGCTEEQFMAAAKIKVSSA
jgi:hypothetical protein